VFGGGWTDLGSNWPGKQENEGNQYMYSIPRRGNASVRLVDPLARGTLGTRMDLSNGSYCSRGTTPFSVPLESPCLLKVLLAWDAVMQGLTWPRLRGANDAVEARTLPIKGRAARTAKGNGVNEPSKRRSPNRPPAVSPEKVGQMPESLHLSGPRLGSTRRSFSWN
jgi:hypothetical protein